METETTLALLRLSHFRTENRIPLFLKMLCRLLADEAALELDPEVVLRGLMPELAGKLPFGPAPLSALDRVADPLPDRSRLLLTRKEVEGSGDWIHGHGGPLR
jgi:hypothetical protein